MLQQCRRFTYEGPFIERQYERAPFVLNEPRDRHILAFHWLQRVGHQDHRLGKTDRAQRVPHRELLELALDARLAAQSGGVDEPDRTALPRPIDGDRIAGDPGLGAGQHSLLADHSVDQGGFSDIRPPDDCELQWFAGSARLSFRGPGKWLQTFVELAQTLAVLRRDRHRIAETET